MTNKELQDLLKQYPDDMPVYKTSFDNCLSDIGEVRLGYSIEYWDEKEMEGIERDIIEIYIP